MVFFMRIYFSTNISTALHIHHHKIIFFTSAAIVTSAVMTFVLHFLLFFAKNNSECDQSWKKLSWNVTHPLRWSLMHSFFDEFKDCFQANANPPLNWINTSDSRLCLFLFSIQFIKLTSSLRIFNCSKNISIIPADFIQCSLSHRHKSYRLIACSHLMKFSPDVKTF